MDILPSGNQGDRLNSLILALLFATLYIFSIDEIYEMKKKNRVSQGKYLAVIIQTDISPSKIIESFCKLARILGSKCTLRKKK